MLNLSHNQLTTLPAEMWQLSKLQVLALGDNQLTPLPAAIEQLSQLQVLILSDNQLTIIPRLPRVGKLNIEGNPL